MDDVTSLLKKTRPLVDGQMLAVLPRRLSKKSLDRLAGKTRFEYDVEALSNAISAPVWDLLDRGGKRWRPALFLLAAEAVGGKNKAKALLPLAALPELIHEGSLCVDDCEDDSLLRRGKPCLHKKYGVDVAINAGNFLYFAPALLLADKKFSDKQKAAAFEVYARELTAIHLGQATDIWWHKGKGTPTEKRYLQMCALKTGTLARLAAKLGALLAGGTPKQVEALGEFAETIGIAFQIQDDVLNLVGEKFGSLKGVGEDIHEGKRSLTAIHALTHLPKEKAARLRQILGSRSSDPVEIGEAISLMREAHSIDYAKSLARKLVKNAWKKLDEQLKPSEAKQRLKAFADFTVERSV